MSDIAKRCGVSQSTVSFVLNQRNCQNIPQETQDRIWRIAEELHYKKLSRKVEKRAMQRFVLVLASDVTNPYYPFIIKGLEQAAAADGIRILCCNTYHNKETEAALIDMAVDRSFSAAIFLYPPEDPQKAAKINRKMPVIAICDKDASLEIDLIELNNFRAGCIAAKHLIDYGHRKIAVLSSDPARSLSRSNRLKGVMHQMRMAGLEEHLAVFTPGDEKFQDAPGNSDSYKIGYTLAQKEEVLYGGYTAIIAINDMIAIGAMDALSAHDIYFPQDYSIIGFDNLLYTGLSRISLTTVDYHSELLAHAAIDLVNRRTEALDDLLLTSTRFKVECAPELVLRSSTAELR